MGATIIEDESHMLYECDLYEDIKANLITRLNRSTPIQNTHPNNPELTLYNFIDQQALRTNLIDMLSPYTTSNINDNPADSKNIHHKPLSIKPTALIEQKLNYRRSYIVNCICTFICHTFEKRRKFIHELQHQSEIQNTITINLDRERIN